MAGQARVYQRLRRLVDRKVTLHYRALKGAKSVKYEGYLRDRFLWFRVEGAGGDSPAFAYEHVTDVDVDSREIHITGMKFA